MGSKRKNRREMILKGDIYKVLLTLSLPIMINSIIQTLYNLVDGVYVSMISSVHFAATSFVWPVNFLFISLGMGLSVAGTSIISQLVGKNNMDDAKKYSEQLIVITILMSIFFSIIGYLITPMLIKIMGARGKFAEYSNTYLKITFLDLPFMFLFFNVNSIMNAQGDTITPTILSAISAIINIILDPILIFNLDMGIAGAAIATLISRMILALTGSILLYTDRNEIKPSFKNFKYDKRISREILNVAIPASVGQSGSALGFMVLNVFITSYGTATMAAFGMVNRITSLVMQPAMGIGSALTAIVGQNMGADRLDRVKESFRKAIILTVLIGGIGCLILILFDKEIINFFMKSKDDPEVIDLSITYLLYISLSMPFMGIFSVFQGIFQGSGHTKYSMRMEIGRLWLVRLPMILVFREFTKIGPEGIWFSMSFSNVVVCIYGYLVYRAGYWEEKLVNT